MLLTGSDITNFCLDRADEKYDGSSRFQSMIGNLLIEAWREIYTEHPFLGLLGYPPQAQVLPAALTALKLSVVAPGVGKAGVLSGIPLGVDGQPVSIQNWWALVASSPSGQTYYMRVTAHASGSVNVTLDAVPEVLANQTVALAQMELTLASGTGVLANGLWTSGGGVEQAYVHLHGEEELLREYPGLPQQSWPPDMAARVSMTTLRLSHWDIKPHRVEIPYFQELDDPAAGALAIPRHLIIPLAEKTLALLYEAKGDIRQKLADARYAAWISKAKGYEHLLKTGLGVEGQRRRNEPY